MGGEISQILPFVGFYNFISVSDWLLAIGFIMISFIRTPAVISGDADALIIVSGDRGNIPFSDFVDNLIGPDVVADEITQAIDKIRFLLFYAFEASLQSR